MKCSSIMGRKRSSRAGRVNSTPSHAWPSSAAASFPAALTGAAEVTGPLAGSIAGGRAGLSAAPPPWNLVTGVLGAGLGGMVAEAMLGAAIACLTLRVNLPVAIVSTLYTNPFTIVPLYLVAYKIGSFTLGVSGGKPADPPPEWDWSAMLASAEAIGRWMVGLGAPLALGVFLLACLLSAAGYFVVRVAWNVYLRHAWLQRRRRRPG